MTSSRVRLSLDTRLWEAVQAVAAARKMDPADLVTEALQVYFGPGSLIETAAELAREHVAKVHEIADQLRVIQDYIVDHTPHDIDPQPVANGARTGGKLHV